MMRLIKKHWPLFLTIFILLSTVAVLLFMSINQNQGNLIYTLDDAYIHMAMAKNFVRHGSWGVTKLGFTSASSSPLWTALLSSAYFLFGVSEISPLLLNILFALVLCGAVYFLLRHYKMPSLYVFVVLLLMLFFTPVPTTIFSGMEHVLHILLTVSFIFLSARVISDNSSRRESVALLLLAPFLLITRPESLFFILAACGLLAVRRRFAYSFLLFGASLSLLTMYGLFSVHKGWFFLPNSIVLKSAVPYLLTVNVGKIFLFAFKQFFVEWQYPLLFLVFSAFFFIILQLDEHKTIWKESTIMLIIFIFAVPLHTFSTRWNLFFRYDAYLVAAWVLITAVVLWEILSKHLSTIKKRRAKGYLALVFLVLLIAASPLVVRGASSITQTPRATTNIYEQQYQVGLFVRKFYSGKTVAVNDIGAINYLADIKCFDVLGLSNKEVAKMLRKRCRLYDCNHQEVIDLAHSEGAEIAVLYVPKMLSPWVKVGQWKISNNVVCGDDTVYFYARDTLEADMLAENLKAFSASLPEGIKQTIITYAFDVASS